MKLILWFNQAYAVNYIPNTMEKIDLPKWAHLITIERILFIFLFVILIRPLLKEQTDPELEKSRINLLRLSAIAGILAIVIRIYRYLSGY